MSKRYYWLKLQDDFFSALKIKKLRKTANGDLLTIIYLKMQLLSVKNGGVLLFEGVESSFEEELALALDEDTDAVRQTVGFLRAQGMLEQVDGRQFLLTDTASNIGSESESAARVRSLRYRQDTQPLHSDENVTPDIERDKEKDRDREIEIDTGREGEKEKEGEGEIPQPIAENGMALPKNKQKFEYTNRFRPGGRPPASENPYCRMQKRYGGMDSPFAGYLPIFQVYRQSVRDRNGS